MHQYFLTIPSHSTPSPISYGGGGGGGVTPLLPSPVPIRYEYEGTSSETPLQPKIRNLGTVLKSYASTNRLVLSPLPVSHMPPLKF